MPPPPPLPPAPAAAIKAEESPASTGFSLNFKRPAPVADQGVGQPEEKKVKMDVEL